MDSSFYIALSLVGLLVVLVVLVSKVSNSCTGDCNQGRNCTCWRKK